MQRITRLEFYICWTTSLVHSHQIQPVTTRKAISCLGVDGAIHHHLTLLSSQPTQPKPNVPAQ